MKNPRRNKLNIQHQMQFFNWNLKNFLSSNFWMSVMRAFSVVNWGQNWHLWAYVKLNLSKWEMFFVGIELDYGSARKWCEHEIFEIQLRNRRWNHFLEDLFAQQLYTWIRFFFQVLHDITSNIWNIFGKLETEDALWWIISMNSALFYSFNLSWISLRTCSTFHEACQVLK